MRRKPRNPKLTFPTELGNEVAVCVEIEMVPLLCGLLRKWEVAETWATDEDWQQGYKWAAQFQEQLMAGCLNTGIQTIIDEQRRLYRLLDTAFNGAVYTATAYGPMGGGGGSWGEGGGGGGTWGDASGGGGSWGSTSGGDYTYVPGDEGEEDYLYVVSPALPPVPQEPVTPGLRIDLKHLPDISTILAHSSGLADGATAAQIELFTQALGARLKQINDQGLDTLGLLQTEIARYPAAGEIPDGWLGLGRRKVELADLLQALRVGDAGDKNSLWSKFQAILDAGGDVVQITSTLNDLFNTTVGGFTEGGIIGMQIGATLAALAAQQQTTEDLKRIIADLDGGETERPADNILQALRGDTEASSTRNAASLLQEIKDRLTEADPNDDSLLEELRKLLL